MTLSDFDINFNKFKNEQDTIEYQIEDTFFKLKEGSLYDQCDIAVRIVCCKKDSTITLNYSLNGSLSSSCERCLKDIEIEINTQFEYPLKLTNNETLLQEEHYLSASHQIYNTYDSLYEHICMSVPFRKICSNSLNKTECKIIHQETTSEKMVDERWAELKKLIKK